MRTSELAPCLHEPAGRRRPDAALTRRRTRSSSPRPRSGWCTCACCWAARSDRRSSAPRCAWCSRAGTPPARAARSSGWSSQLDPRHVRVAQFAAPDHDEKRHHFLWRFWPTLPGWGGMAVFDRSWYGRVLVERVEGLPSVDTWQRAYAEIVDFETHPRRRGHDPRQVLDARLAGGAAPPVREAPRRSRSRPGSSPTRTGATARSAPRTKPPSRRCSTAPTPPVRPVARRRRRGQAVGARRRRPHRVRGRWSRRSLARGIDADPPIS